MANNAPNNVKSTDGAVLAGKSATPATARATAAFAKTKDALQPKKILKYILARLLKPVIAFTLLFILFLGGAYAGSYFKLFNAERALNFESLMPALRGSGNVLAREALPIAEWTVSVLSAAGEVIQSRVERQEALRLKEEKEEEEALRAQREEEERAASQEREKQEVAAGAAQNPPEARPAEDEMRRREAERRKQEEELKKAVAANQQELLKRAGKLAVYYAAMPAADAVRILKNMENDEIIMILNNMPDAMASQILAGFEPDRASIITRNILKLHPTPTEEALISSGLL